MLAFTGSATMREASRPGSPRGYSRADSDAQRRRDTRPDSPAPALPERRVIDLSHGLRTGMPVFPGDPAVSVVAASGADPWHVSKLELGTHSGTHVDAASHYVPGGRTIDRYPLDRFLLPAYVVEIDVSEGTAIEWPALAGVLPADLSGTAVLLHTGWDQLWGRSGSLRHPYLAESACIGLVEAGVGLVGTDALNVDATDPATTHAHAILLAADVLIVENLSRLSALEPGRAYACAFVPLKLENADGSPVRAYAFVGDT